MKDEHGTQPSEVTKPGEAATACPACSTPRTTGDRFCETCGHDFEAVETPESVVWELVIEADRDYHTRFAAAGIAFPEDAGAQRIRLDAAELLVGRRDGGPSAPDISGAAEDPALSRRHAVLRRLDEGGYAIEDLGSTNGTDVNGQPLTAGEPVVLADGDRVHLGAWTAMTVRSRAA